MLNRLLLGVLLLSLSSPLFLVPFLVAVENASVIAFLEVVVERLLTLGNDLST